MNVLQRVVDSIYGNSAANVPQARPLTRIKESINKFV